MLFLQLIDDRTQSVWSRRGGTSVPALLLLLRDVHTHTHTHTHKERERERETE